jgi:hypothetical protein
MQLESAKQKLEEEQKAQMLATQQNAPIEIGGNLVRLNPTTGQYEVVYSSPVKEKYAPGSIGEYQFYAEQETAAGRIPKSFNEYQTEDANRKAFASALAGQNGLTPQQTQNFIHITDNFQKDEIMKNAISGQQAILVADQVIADPYNAANQLKSLYTLVKSLDPNSAVREGEISLAEKAQSYLQNFSTALTRLSSGQVIDPKTALQLAQASKELAQAWYTTAQGREKQYASQAQVAGIGQAFQQYLGSYSAPYSSTTSGENPNDPLGLFSSDLSTSVNGSNDVQKVMDSIGQFESGGDYGAIGPVVTSGQYKGEQALGKYQIMPGNIPRWSKEALGYSITPEQFLASPQLQDAIARYKMQQMLDKYGTVEDVASVWFSGKPLATAGNVKDVLGTSVQKYTSGVRSIYNTLG